MFLDNKRIAGIVKYAFTKHEALNQADFTALNVESLKGTLSYFSQLHSKGEISDQAFEALVRYACAIFIENEVEERVQEALEHKLTQFWNLKLSPALEEYISERGATVYRANISQLLKSQ